MISIPFLGSFLLSALAASGLVSGTVRDSSGGALPGAQVRLHGQDGREIRRTTADEEGRYRIDSPAGSFVLRAEHEMFLPVAKSIEVGEAQSLQLDFDLPLASLSELVTVSGEIEPDFREVPGSVDYVEQKAIESSLAHNLKDVLTFTPGVLVQPRFGADESQVSIRGSGLRGNFHLRGLNLFLNGLPYQDADGFGDFESIDLMAAAGIEVWKGANALRYGGNSLGGALNIRTHTGETAAPLQGWLQGGSFGHFRGQVSTGGQRGGLRYYASFSDTELGGYREHSEQSRKRVFSNLGFNLDPKTDLRIDFIYAHVSEELPGSLTRDELLSDPRKADPVNVAQDWGRFYDYFRIGAGVTRELGAGRRLELSVSTQLRDMVHPIFQVLDNDSLNFAFSVVYSMESTIAGLANDLVVGVSPRWGTADERRYENVSGQSGALAADFETDASNLGFFFEDRLFVRDDLRLVVGGRSDWARREFRDRFLVDGDRSDERTFRAFVPRLGLVWDRSETVQIYGNVSRSYEPPLLLELTSFGAPGLLDLKAQDSWQIEVGSRGSRDRLRWDVAFFDAEIRDEILNVNLRPFSGAPFTIPSYRNADRTRHQGVELGAELGFDGFLSPGGRLAWQNAYTWSRFRFVDDAVHGDNALPGAPEHVLRTELRYDHSSGLWIAPNLDWSPKAYFVDSANTVENDGYAVLNLRAGYDLEKLSIFLQATNLTDRIYSGSVQVDSASGRFFEPSNGRSIFAGVRFRL